MKKILLVIISLFIIGGCASRDIKTNNNELVIKEQVIDNLKFSDVSLIYEKGISTFKVTITNNGDSITPETFNVIFKDKDDKVITVLDGTFGSIDKDNFISLTLTSSDDLTHAYKVEYEIK